MDKHPKWKDIEQVALQFPEQATTLFVMYLDLLLVKQFPLVQVKPCPEIGRPICLTRPRLDAGQEWVIPVAVEQGWSMTQLIEWMELLPGKPETAVLGIVGPESTMSYYRLKRGLVPPQP